MMEGVSPRQEILSCCSQAPISRSVTCRSSLFPADFVNWTDSNLFGERDPKHYGSTTLAQIEERVTEVGKELGVKV